MLYCMCFGFKNLLSIKLTGFYPFQGWRPAITVKQIVVGIQDLLDQPNPDDPAQTDGYHLFIQVFSYISLKVILLFMTYEKECLFQAILAHFCRIQLNTREE